MLFLSKHNRVILLRACFVLVFVAVRHLVPLAPHNFESFLSIVHTFSSSFHRNSDSNNPTVLSFLFISILLAILGKMNTPAFIDGFTVPL
ncbi:hypothetical protein T05_2136 [Trichinella murrelli]|uniref:Uncharacterized protein n=1 Tax=Trichinella murrelli TaxID=144512 RepID=A0A0V0T7Z6_9BILA|nr:hypothetical protein T05_2136 [Trichinella murrelli]